MSLASLVQLYYRAGRFAYVLKVFEQAPYWGAADLADLNNRYTSPDDYPSHTGISRVTVPLGFDLAASLAKTGHAAEAGKVLAQLLVQTPGCDRLYELLLALDGEQAPARLDELFARDQFEERPLIWKAHWLRTHQRLEAAEQVARKAIAIDPTDGEEPPGDRLRAYAELAEIRAARGDQKEADLLRGAVQAVHQAENADEFQEAGLLKRAVANGPRLRSIASPTPTASMPGWPSNCPTWACTRRRKNIIAVPTNGCPTVSAASIATVLGARCLRWRTKPRK